MSWVNGEIIINDLSKKELNIAYAKIRASVRHEADLEEFPNIGDYINEIKLLNNTVYNDVDSARNFIQSKYSVWKRKYSAVVAFKDTSKAKTTSKIINLEQRIEKEKEKLDNYKNAHSVNNYKAKLVGCPKCGSKINKDYIRGDRCPLCGQDLRSITTIETIKRYRLKIKELEKQVKEEKSKQSKKLPTKYLVCYEEYIG